MSAEDISNIFYDIKDLAKRVKELEREIVQIKKALGVPTE